MYAVHGGRGPLVELSGDVFHGDVFFPLEGKAVGDGIGHHLAENAVAALLQERIGEAEQVVHIDEPERAQIQGQVFLEFGEEARRLHAETFPFFDKDSPASIHIQ